LLRCHRASFEVVLFLQVPLARALLHDFDRQIEAAGTGGILLAHRVRKTSAPASNPLRWQVMPT